MTLLDSPGKLTLADIVLLAGLLVATDPANEAACRAPMKAHATAGDLASARQAHFRCRNELKAEYGAEPDATTVRLALELGIIAPAAPVVAETASVRLRPPIRSASRACSSFPPETMLSEPLLQRRPGAPRRRHDRPQPAARLQGDRGAYQRRDPEPQPRQWRTAAHAAGIALRLHRLRDHSRPRG